ncbi:type II secretion system ATPase GspE [Candidatus Uabimicrobium sp. HlEnr_7]|uniref:type II secretion system ATPase GspE n=1 Tax=Candidatus Uabimicrobium helgolandensis TaxID=3095367 RepID=UPI0035589128
MARRLLGQILKDKNLITEPQIQQALSIQKNQGGAIGKIFIEQGWVSDQEVLFALGQQFGMDAINLDEKELDPDIIKKVPYSMANIYRVIPVSFRDDMLTIAMADPMNVQVLDDLRMMLHCEVQGSVSNEEQIQRAIDKYYSDDGGGNFDELINEFRQEEEMIEVSEAKDGYDLDDVNRMAESAPVIKLLNLILMQAIKDKGSDIHFEPFERDFKIRYRVDGVLYEMMPPPQNLALALISRIKVMSNLDISETRLPQDGRIELTIGGRPVDLRVSTLPTMFGESCVMRILDRSVVNLDLESLGFRERELETMRIFIAKPNGIVLVTGPTGSGKTTTLYSALSEANKIEVKIITTEDPVEYDIDGIMQCQVNHDVGLTYAAALRSILRQDPDKVLVGEIRDKETAGIAIEAALTGHLVFSTLHTNDSAGSVARLVDMGIEPFLIAATVQGVIAQRLVRRICSNCKVEYTPSLEEVHELGMEQESIGSKKFAYGKGCSNCNKSGYRGRTALYEILLANDNIAQLILERGSTGQIRDLAREQGMRTLRESGLLAIFDGVTTVEEVVRETLF